MTIVPVISLIWVAVQYQGSGGPIGKMAHRVQFFATQDLPGLRKEMTLLVMAGFIGALGSAIAAPLAEDAGISFATVPTWLLLLCIFWSIPITGQLGMNPILAVSLFG